MESKRATEVLAALIALAVTLAVTACSTPEAKMYDIGPIFPLSPTKCAKYNGEAEDEGPLAHCWVKLADCQRAAADWNSFLKRSGSPGVRFGCN